MDLFDELKHIEKIVSDSIKNMDSISKEFCKHLESLKAAKKKDRRKIEDKLKKYVDSLGTKREKKVNRYNQLQVSHSAKKLTEEHSYTKVHKTESKSYKNEMTEAVYAAVAELAEEQVNPKSQINERQIHKNSMHLEPPDKHVGSNDNETRMQISTHHLQLERNQNHSDPRIHKNNLLVSENHSPSAQPDDHSDSKIQKNHSITNKTKSRPQPSEEQPDLKVHKNYPQISESNSQSEEQSDPQIYKNRSQTVKNQSHLEATEEHSDDDNFLSGPVSQKPKKPLCLSIKKSAKNPSKVTAGKRWLDSIRDEERIFCSTPTNQGRDEEQTRISISWTIRIKETSSQHTNHVRITGSERVNLETPRHCKPPSSPQPSNALEYEEEQENPESCKDSTSDKLELEAKISETVETPNSTGIRFSKYEDVRNTSCKTFQECRVVVRKLSTSNKIFQPKVVLRKLTGDEINKIFGSFCETSEDDKKPNFLLPKTILEEQRSDLATTVRYTSLILEPARKFPRMFSTIKMRCSITKMILTPPQMDLKPDTNKNVEQPTKCNDIMKSMFKTKSKCVQDWRSKTRTKDQGKCELNPRKSLDLSKYQEKHPGTQMNKAVTGKFEKGIKRSKCTQEWRFRSRTKDIQGKTCSNPKTTSPIVSHKPANANMKLEPRLKSTIRDVIVERGSKGTQVASTKLGDSQERLKTAIPAAHQNQATGNSEQEPKKEESESNKVMNEPSSENYNSESNLRKLEHSGKVVPENMTDVATKCPSPCADSGRDLKGHKYGTETGHLSPRQSTKPTTTKVINIPENVAGIPRKEQSAFGRLKKATNKSPKKMVLMTPMRLKYSVKSRSKSIQSSPIKNGRVTRSRIKIEHSQTNSASRSKNIIPGSQLTFLIESFRR